MMQCIANILVYSSKTKTVSFRLPTEIVEAMNSRAISTGTSKTYFVIQALRVALGLPNEMPSERPLTERISELELRLSAVEECIDLERDR